MIMDNKRKHQFLNDYIRSPNPKYVFIVSVKTGEQLKLDVLSNADKVQHQNETSAEWTEIWSRSDRDQSDRLTDSDGTLTINNFTASDAGTYRVLDTEGEILITVTVTGERSSAEHFIFKKSFKILYIYLLAFFYASAVYFRC
uniref:Ig-like domain-containing protein n=1 Tax=Sinocyclocheilus grahami TaxID=75366 RepID=A0A672LB53_SINGR